MNTSGCAVCIEQHTLAASMLLLGLAGITGAVAVLCHLPRKEPAARRRALSGNSLYTLLEPAGSGAPPPVSMEIDSILPQSA